jgi:hypothetical protein
LSYQLREVFEEFRIRSDGQRIIVEPKLRPEWLPEGSWRTLDFGDEQGEGVEVVEYLEPLLRQVDLADGLITDSS